MYCQWIKIIHQCLLLFLFLLPQSLHASFIESTMGAAVVNDATAVYFNPAALVLLKNPQIVLLDSIGKLHSEFTGEFTQTMTGFSQSGTSATQTHYNLPSFYIAIPTTNRLTIGLALVTNHFNKDIEGSTLLRYAESSNKVENIDVVPAVEYKINDYISVGAAMNFSYGYFLLMPTSGVPSLNIPDTQSRNECDGTGIGEDIGFIFKPHKTTIIGLNYRTAITYRLTGTSIFESTPPVVSNNYGFTFWTPARTVLSVNQSLTPALGLIGTIQRIQWSIFNEINIHGIATRIAGNPVIFDANVPYHFRDTWLATFGGHYRITPKWIVRVASSYNQSPASGNFQISNGDSIIVGGSMGYDISKHFTIDAGYAHAFIQNQDIHIANSRNKIDGATHGYIDMFSLKLTVNLV